MKSFHFIYYIVAQFVAQVEIFQASSILAVVFYHIWKFLMLFFGGFEYHWVGGMYRKWCEAQLRLYVSFQSTSHSLDVT